jgi:ABC-type antimicrobial peptide transport system permease subunit
MVNTTTLPTAVGVLVGVVAGARPALRASELDMLTAIASA